MQPTDHREKLRRGAKAWLIAALSAFVCLGLTEQLAIPLVYKKLRSHTYSGGGGPIYLMPESAGVLAPCPSEVVKLTPEGKHVLVKPEFVLAMNRSQIPLISKMADLVLRFLPGGFYDGPVVKGYQVKCRLSLIDSNRLPQPEMERSLYDGSLKVRTNQWVDPSEPWPRDAAGFFDFRPLQERVIFSEWKWFVASLIAMATMLVAGGASAIRSLWLFSRLRRIKPGTCVACGYPHDGSTMPCPECGIVMKH